MKMTSKKQLFMSIRAPFFSNQSMLGAIFAQILEILPGFYGILAGFSPNQNFLTCGCTPAPPPPTPVPSL